MIFQNECSRVTWAYITWTRGRHNRCHIQEHGWSSLQHSPTRHCLREAVRGCVCGNIM